jgi:hypothetical protein
MISSSSISSFSPAMISSFLAFSIFLLLGPFQSEAMVKAPCTGTASQLRMVNSQLSSNLSRHDKLVHNGSSAAGHISFPTGAVPAGPISIKGDHRNRNAVVVNAIGINGEHPISPEDQQRKKAIDALVARLKSNL